MTGPLRSTARILVLALALFTIISAAGCSGNGGSGGSSGSGEQGSATSSSIASAADLAAALKRDHADADWYEDVTDVTETTVLGAPAIFIHTTWKLLGETDPAAFDTVNAKQQALGDALGTYDFTNTVNLFVQRADGALQPVRSTGAGARSFAEAFDLPPAPKSPAELKQWLEKVYGPGGIVKLGPDEDWYGSIKSVKPGESSSDAAIIETSLPDNADPRFSIVLLAVSSSNTPLLQQGIWVVALDGSGTSIAGGAGSPLFYPAP